MQQCESANWKQMYLYIQFVYKWKWEGSKVLLNKGADEPLLQSHLIIYMYCEIIVGITFCVFARKDIFMDFFMWVILHFVQI